LSDIIQLLPDNVANQIAAGEVLQRPASAVKELLENSVDAGATDIQLLLKDAGKELIQVIDNGKGMSEIDARLCFEKHATSKIQRVEDLFNINTMGFRGEALASVAAVARVELKTKLHTADTGTQIDIEDSKVINQQPCATPAGTNLSIKNLFFNIPARRNFLKSNTTELKNCIDEFVRVALAFPHIAFSMYHNGMLVHKLQSGTLKMRISQLFGNHITNKLVTVREDTDYLTIEGFVGKPDTAKKTRGDQYFIVNNRFIRSPYLHHAVMGAFKNLLAVDSFPFYVLCFTIDPAHIDVNVHPTKQEIKFEDDKIVYAFLNSAIKHALAQFSVSPTLDFELDNNIQQLSSVNDATNKSDIASASNTSLFQSFTEKNKAHFIEPDNAREKYQWQKFEFPLMKDALHEQRERAREAPVNISQQTAFHIANIWSAEAIGQYKITQFFNEFITAEVGADLYVFQQKYMHERILFNKLIKAFDSTALAIQPSLFPDNIEVGPADAVLLTSILPMLKTIGYHIEPFGNNTFIVHGSPAHSTDAISQNNIDQILDAIKHDASINAEALNQKIVKTFAQRQATKVGKLLSLDEMKHLITQLFAGENPNISPSGKKVFYIMPKSQWQSLFL
jgi:DNA mismatch repair protein MutL